MDPSADPSPDPSAAPPGALPLYGLDIETDTSVDGLDPSRARVVAVALCTGDGDGAGDEVFLGDEASLLTRVDKRLRELEPGVLVTWNGSGFDLPFLAVRAARCRVELDLQLWDRGHGAAPTEPWPPPPLGVGGRWGAHGHLDGFRSYRADVRRSLGLSCGLKAMARLVGLTPVEVDMDQLHTLAPDQLADYVASDARLARALVVRRGPAALAAVDRPGTGSLDPRPELSAVPAR